MVATARVKAAKPEARVPASRARTAAAAESKQRKGRGRPAGGHDDVGREALLGVTREILRTTPPETVTRLMIAERANVDPGLIRYYFGTVSHLITEIVVDSHLRIRQSVLDIVATREPAEALRTRIGLLVDLFIDYPYHHRLIRQVMYGEGNDAEHAEWVVSLRSSVDQTRTMIEVGVQEGIFRNVDYRMLQIALIGVAEFFGGNPEIIGDVFDRKESVRTMRDEYVDFLAQLFLHGLCRRD
jgi:AcrR family transcriptional regulator